MGSVPGTVTGCPSAVIVTPREAGHLPQRPHDLRRQLLAGQVVGLQDPRP